MSPNMKTLYSLYVHVRKSDLPEEKQYNLIRALMAGEEWSWRVEGISVKALRRFKDNDFKKTKGIHRHHVVPFRETCQQMLQTILTETEWCELAYNNEKVHLVTKEENNEERFSTILPIDPELGLFKNNKKIGYTYRIGEEGQFLRCASQELLSF